MSHGGVSAIVLSFGALEGAAPAFCFCLKDNELKSALFHRYDAEGRRLRLKAVGYLERALVTIPKDPNLHRTIDGIFTGLQLTRMLPATFICNRMHMRRLMPILR